MAKKDNPTKCGFVALLGAANAGKSTLMNTLVGSKISIVSDKPQTTRMRVLGVSTEGTAQIIYVDLPGIFEPRRKLDRAMVAAAWDGASSADLVLVMVDSARREIATQTYKIIEWLKKEDKKAILVLNKVDAVPKDKLLGLTEKLFKSGVFTEVLMISAKTGSGFKELETAIAKALPEGPWQYDAETLTDLPTRLWAAEITREHAFHQLKQELPYAVAVETEAWEEFKNGSVKVVQIIYVERDTQRAIVLGERGARIKAIGTAARTEMETELERKIHLFLHVKVKEGWAESAEFLHLPGLESKTK